MTSSSRNHGNLTVPLGQSPLAGLPEIVRTTDLLEQAIDFVRPRLDCSLPISDRLETLWAASVAARDLGSADVIENEMIRLAYETGLAGDLGRHAEQDLRHVIRWAMLDLNPFG
jgi:hypothetical protein